MGQEILSIYNRGVASTDFVATGFNPLKNKIQQVENRRFGPYNMDRAYGTRFIIPEYSTG
jgi:hypothetical protein